MTDMKDKLKKAIHNIEKRRGNIRELTIAEIVQELESELTPEPDKIEQNLTGNYDIYVHVPLQVKKSMKGKLILQPKPQMTTEEFYAERNGGKDALQSTADNELITPVYACILMKDYYEYVSQFQKPLPEELSDILNCLISYDKSAPLEEKGRYFEVIQRDIDNYLKTK